MGGAGKLGLDLAREKDLARHFGQSYALDPVHYVGTPPMITALANDQIEIANLAYSTLGIAVENAGLDDMRVVADEFQDGVDDYYSEEYMVRNDSPIQKVEDLKGRVVATNAAGSAVDVAMMAMLHKHGLEPNRDYTVVEAPLPAMKAMLAE
jgi:sulfonate transport system substrate-binding protein